jgi:D-aspartate ligase
VKALEQYLARRPMPPAVVADVGWVNGLAAIRQLERAGIPVIALDQRRSALGFRSRYGFGVLSPDPLRERDAYVELLVRLGDVIGRPAPIFPTHDDHLAAIAGAAEELGDRFRYPFPPWKVLEGVQRKRFQLERATELGVPTPRTASEPTDELGFPVLVKPSEPLEFRRVFKRQSFRCETRGELDEAWERARRYDPLVQELIPGGDEELYSLGSYLAADGEALGLFCGRKLLQTPPGVGTARVGEAVWVDEVVEQGLGLVRGLGVFGIAQTEFKRDPRDGIFKLMEVNPRLWQWHGLAAACGVDVPRIAYWDLLGARLPPARSNGTSRRWAITHVAGTRPAFLRPPYVEAIFARDDPGPALAQAARLVRGLGR